MNEQKIEKRTRERGRFTMSLLSLKTRLAKEVARCCSLLGLSQRETAKKIGVTQPDVSALSRGQCESFSVERLFQLLSSLGKQVAITIKDKPSPQASPITVKVSRE